MVVECFGCKTRCLKDLLENRDITYGQDITQFLNFRLSTPIQYVTEVPAVFRKYPLKYERGSTPFSIFVFYADVTRSYETLSDVPIHTFRRAV